MQSAHTWYPMQNDSKWLHQLLKKYLKFCKCAIVRHSWLKLFFAACYLNYQICFKLQGLENSKSFSYNFLNEKCPRNIFQTQIFSYPFLVKNLVSFPVSFFFFFSWCKRIFWIATCQEKKKKELFVVSVAFLWIDRYTTQALLFCTT